MKLQSENSIQIQLIKLHICCTGRPLSHSVKDRAMTKILVIEDEQIVREAIQDLLELEGFQTLGAPNGGEGVQLAQDNLPDLILCDVQMPDMNGYDVLTSLIHNPSTNTIPFIFLTAKGTRTDQRYGMELGADDYLVKPCTAEELLRAIASRLSKHSAVENRIQQELGSLRSSIALSLPHELRTPITSILSSVELLRVLAPSITENRITEIADDVEGAVQRLYRLIQNYLAYIQLELIARDPNRLNLLQYECLDDCVGVITETSQNLAQKLERSDDLVLHLQNAAIVIAHSQFHKIILELTDNAFKFSPPNTPVTLRSWVEGDSFVVEVRDCGRGMTPTHIAQVGAYFQFDRHYYEQQGLGLGLAIARRILDIYQGNFQIESVLNEGTTVRASFRLWKEQGGDG